jgi:hypothetical protein
MKRIAELRRRRSARTRSSAAASTVTSSPGVGCRGTRSAGSAISADPLLPATRQLVRKSLQHALAQVDLGEHLSQRPMARRLNSMTRENRDTGNERHVRPHRDHAVGILRPAPGSRRRRGLSAPHRPARIRSARRAEGRDEQGQNKNSRCVRKKRIIRPSQVTGDGGGRAPH